ncbi:MAG: hypothetical protein PVH80_09700 [Anaerolineae bacterium]|jgi:hypothetical protein
MSVTESVVRCLIALGLLAAPFAVLVLVSVWRERRGNWKRSRVARGAVRGALAFEAALDPSRRAAIEYILTEQDEVQEEDGEGQGVPPIVVSPDDVVYTPPRQGRLEEDGSRGSDS